MKHSLLFVSLVIISINACAPSKSVTQTAIIQTLSTSSTVTIPPIQTKNYTSTLSTLEQSPESNKVQIGFYSNLYLVYDNVVWNAYSIFYDGHLNNDGEEIHILDHRIYGCQIQENLGHGVPETWVEETYIKQIGHVNYQVEMWTDTSIDQPVLIVYQYPPESPQNYRRIELTISDHAEECIFDAEEVLLLSEKYITRP